MTQKASLTSLRSLRLRAIKGSNFRAGCRCRPAIAVVQFSASEQPNCHPQLQLALENLVAAGGDAAPKLPQCGVANQRLAGFRRVALIVPPLPLAPATPASIRTRVPAVYSWRPARMGMTIELRIWEKTQ